MCGLGPSAFFGDLGAGFYGDLGWLQIVFSVNQPPGYESLVTFMLGFEGHLCFTMLWAHTIVFSYLKFYFN